MKLTWISPFTTATMYNRNNIVTAIHQAQLLLHGNDTVVYSDNYYYCPCPSNAKLTFQNLKSSLLGESLKGKTYRLRGVPKLL